MRGGSYTFSKGNTPTNGIRWIWLVREVGRLCSSDTFVGIKGNRLRDDDTCYEDPSAVTWEDGKGIRVWERGERERERERESERERERERKRERERERESCNNDRNIWVEGEVIDVRFRYFLSFYFLSFFLSFFLHIQIYSLSFFLSFFLFSYYSFIYKSTALLSFFLSF